MRNPTIAFLSNQLAPHRRTVAGLSILAILAAAFDTVIPVLYGRALDVVIEQQPLTVLVEFLSMWLILRLVTDALRRHLAFTGQRIAITISYAFIRAAEDCLLGLDIGTHHAHRSGDIQERVHRVQQSLHQLLRTGVFTLLPNLLTIVVISAYLFTVHIGIGVAHAAVIAVFVLQSYGYIPAFDAAWEHTAAIERKFFGRIWDAVRNVLVVKSCNAEAYERECAARFSTDILASHVSIERLFRRHNAWHDVTYAVGTIVLFGTAAAGIQAGWLTPGQLMMVFGYSFLTWGIIRGITWVYWEYVALGTYLRQYEEIARIPPEPYGVGASSIIRGEIEYDSVRFRYREDTPVLEDVSFRVTVGEVVAIVGESGEGKTTIVDLLSRYYEPQSGEIRMDGIPLREVELGNLRSQLAVVPQDLTLFHASLRENIRYGRLNATDAEVEEAARSAALHDWIAELPEGYDTVVGERGLKLSAGQRQRVAIARAFIRNPRILILDEPTSQLDAATEAQVQLSLQKLMRGRTTFVIAHRLRTIQHADQILVLENGRIAEHGTHEDLMRRSGSYRWLHDLQFGDIKPLDAPPKEEATPKEATPTSTSA